MTDNEIVRLEAKEFYERELSGTLSSLVIDSFKLLKERLMDFYSDENKLVFLDEIKNTLTINLKKHRDDAHGGEVGVDCDFEISKEKFLFYINQEIKAYST